MRIAVLLGGDSEERDVSLASGCQVARALRERGHDVHAVDTRTGILSPEAQQRVLDTGVPRELSTPPTGLGSLLETIDYIATEPRLAGLDLAFPILHGGAGEDGTIQTLLDVAGLPYVGSGPVGCALAMDKDLSKRLLLEASIPTAPWITGRARAAEVVDRVGLPAVVKPASGGSSLRLALVRAAEELDDAAALAEAGGDVVMYERYVEGREYTVGVLGEDVLPVGEIVPEHDLFDYECKYQQGMAAEIFPAQTDPDLALHLQSLAIATHRALRLEGFSRVDFIVDREGRSWCLEANALPGLTAASLYPKAASAAGMSFGEVCEKIAELGLERGRRRSSGGSEPVSTRAEAP